VRLRILDRFVLGAAWPALAASAAVTALVVRTFDSPDAALATAPYALCVGLAVVYGRWGRSGEFTALLQAGVSPRRVGAVVVLISLVTALAGATFACAFFPPDVPTRYAGYVLSALQLPLMASLALPTSLESRTEEPWARMALLLVGYALFSTAVRVAGLAAGWAPGLEWLFVDGALLGTDVALYRRLARPRAKL
jgi:lipopolysaccharide export LptBFGC system permease protein LptF